MKNLSKVVGRAELLEQKRASRAANRLVLDLAWVALAGRAIEVLDVALTRWNDREDRLAGRRPRRTSC